MRHTTTINKEEIKDYLESMIETPHSITLKKIILNEKDELIVDWEM